MDPQMTEPLITQQLDLPKPLDSKKDLKIIDPADIQEIKKAVSFIESQKNSSFDEQFSRVSVIQPHNASINSMSMTTDEQYAVSGSSDFSVCVWMVQSKSLMAKFSGHRGKVNSVSICDNASLVASASDDRTVKVWNMRMRKEEPLNNANVHKWQVMAVALSPDGKYYVSGSMEKDIVMFNIQKKAIEHKFMYSGITFCIAFSRDSRYFFSAGDDGGLKLHNVFAKRWELELKGHKKAVKGLAYSPDSSFIASASEDHLIIIWNISSRSQEFVLSGHLNDVLSVAYSKDGNFLISGSLDKTVRIWNIKSRKQVHRLDFHSDSVLGVQFFKDNQNFISCSGDSKIAFWSLSSKTSPKFLEGHKNSISSIFLSKDKKFLMSNSGSIYMAHSGELIFWETEGWSESFRLTHSNDGVLCMDLSPDGLSLALGGGDRSLQIFDISLKETKLKLESFSAEVNSVSFSPDGQYLAGASGYINYHRKGELLIWTCSNFEMFWKPESGHSGHVCCAQFFPDSIHLAAAAYSNISVWRVPSKELALTLDNARVIIHSLAVSPDGQTIVTGDRDQFVKFWSFKHARLDLSYKNSKYAVSCLKFSPDSQYLISSSFDGSFCLWNFQEKILESKFEVHEKGVFSVEFDSSSKKFFTGSDDNKIAVWELVKQDPLTSLFGNSIENRSIRFSENYETFTVNNENPEDVKPAVPVEGRPDIKVFLPNGKFDPLSIFDEGLSSFSIFHNALNSIVYDDFSLIEPESWKVLISNLKFTPLHLAAFKGKTQIITDLLQSEAVYFRADGLGRSAIFYSINAKFQTITDLLLDFLIAKAEDSQLEVYSPLFYSVRNDLSVIILNSSPSICNFLSKCLYTKQEPPYFGVPFTAVQFISSINPCPVDFVSEQQTDQEPLLFQSSLFEMPSTIGSETSKELLSSFLRCTNRDLYKMPIVKNFIRNRWESIRVWTYSYTALLWINLVILTVLVDHNAKSSEKSENLEITGSYLMVLIAFIVVNSLLFVWEIMQLINSGWGYLRDSWNIIDLLRVFLTALWLVLQNVMSEGKVLRNVKWFVVLLNLVRGVTGFRAFDTTRYYVGLIIASIMNIKSFLLIFVYTVLSFGLLDIASKEAEVNFEVLWGISFSVGMGDFASMKNDSFDLIYFTYMIAIFLNVILMLNMIISILGDSFDEFQLFSVYFDSREMTQAILEIEEIFSISGRVDVGKYLHVCVNAYQTETSEWQGKVLEVRNLIDRRFDSLFSQNSENLLKITEKIQEIGGKVSVSNNGFEKIQEKVGKIEENMNQMTQGLTEKVSSLESTMKELSQKLETILTRLPS